MLALANLVSYAYVVGLSSIISFDGVIYIVLAMCCIAVPFVIIPSFQGHWGNNLHHMGFCSECRKEEEKVMEIPNHAKENSEMNLYQLNRPEKNTEEAIEEQNNSPKNRKPRKSV